MKFSSIRAVIIPSTILLFARYGRASSTPSNSERLRRVRDKSPYKSGINNDTPHSNQRTQEHHHRQVQGLGSTISSCCCGASYCPSLDACISPWMETCPIADGTAFEGPITLWCEAGVGQCSSSIDEICSWSEGTWTSATYYFPDLEGEFEVPEGCNLDCAGCTTVDTAGVSGNGVSLFSVGDEDESNVLDNNLSLSQVGDEDEADNNVSLFAVGDEDEPNDSDNSVSLFQMADEDEPYDPFLGMGGDEEGSMPEKEEKEMMSMPMTTTTSTSTPDVTPPSGTASSTEGEGEEDDDAYKNNRAEYEAALAGKDKDLDGGLDDSSQLNEKSPSARMGISLLVVALISTLTGLQLLV